MIAPINVIKLDTNVGLGFGNNNNNNNNINNNNNYNINILNNYNNIHDNNDIIIPSPWFNNDNNSTCFVALNTITWCPHCYYIYYVYTNALYYCILLSLIVYTVYILTS